VRPAGKIEMVLNDNYVKCPHCGYECENSWELAGSDSDYECEKCEKVFGYDSEDTRTYRAFAKKGAGDD